MDKNQVLTVEPFGRVSVIRFLCPDIDMDENGILYDEVRRLVKEDKTSILVNFSGISYISSLLIATLISGLKNTKAKGGHFKLCCMSGKVVQALELTQLNKVFEIFKTQDEALNKSSWESEPTVEFK